MCCELVIADNLQKRGWSFGYVSAIDSEGKRSGLLTRIAAVGKRFVVHADEKLTGCRGKRTHA